MYFIDDERPPLPPEMYINQQKWLELRATRRSALISCLCNNINIVSWMIQFSMEILYEKKKKCFFFPFFLFFVIPMLFYPYCVHQLTIFLYVVTANVTILIPIILYFFRYAVLCYVYSRLHFKRWTLLKAGFMKMNSAFIFTLSFD